MDAEISVDEDRGTIDLTVTGSREEIESIMPFDLARAVKEGCRTRDGRPVRIICTDASNASPVVALVLSGGREDPVSYTPAGKYWSVPKGSENDLVNLPEAHEVEIHLYEHPEQGLGGFVLIDDVQLRFVYPHEKIDPGAVTNWTKWGKPVTVRIEKDD